MSASSFGSLDEFILAGTADATASQGSSVPASEDTPANADIQTQAAGVTFAAAGMALASMPGEYININDLVQMTAWNSAPGLASLSAQVRIMRADGELITTTLAIGSLTHDRLPNVGTITQTEGFIVGVVVGPVGVALTRGQCFVQVSVVRGTGANQVTTLGLVADYVTSTFPPSWPNGTYRSSTEGPGWTHVAVGPAPGPGAFPSIQVPQNGKWRVISAFYNWQSSAVAGARAMGLIIAEPAGTIYLALAAFTQAASLLWSYNFLLGMPFSTAAGTRQTITLAQDIELDENGTISGANLGFGDPGDGGSPMQCLVEEWIDV